MGTWFQKRHRLFPDARLELSDSGICVGFDSRHAHVTAPQNQMGQDPVGEDPVEAGAANREAPYQERPATGTRIFRRDRPDTLSSDNLIALADLACEVEARRTAIARTLAACRRRMTGIRIRLGAGRFLISASRSRDLRTALKRLQRTEAELAALLGAAVIDVDFAINEEVRSDYLKMTDTFRGVAGAKRVWHATRKSRVLRLKPARLAVEAFPLFRSDLPALRFGTVNGAELFLMPGLMALRRPGADVALVEMRDLSIQFSPRQAVAAKRWPWGATRAKSDLNWLDAAAPQAQFGDIEIASGTGLSARFVVSDWRALQAFRHALTTFQIAVSREKGHAREFATVPYAEISDLKLPPFAELTRTVRPRRVTVFRVAAATASLCCVLIGVAIVIGIATPRPQAPAVATAISPPLSSTVPTPASVETAQTPPSAPEPVLAPTPTAPSPALAENPVPAVAPPAPEPAPPTVVTAADVAPPKPTVEATATVPVAPEKPDPIPPTPAVAVTEAQPAPEPLPPAPAQAIPEGAIPEGASPEGASPGGPSPEEVVANMPSIVTGAGPSAEAAPESADAAPVAPPPLDAVADIAQAKSDTATPPPAPDPAKPSLDQVAMNNLIASLTDEKSTLTSAEPAPAEPAAAKPAPSSKQEEPKAAKAEATATRGLSETEVAELQTRLYDLGYYFGTADGHLDGGTLEAFNAWRSETGRRAVRTVDHAEYYAFLAAISR